MKANFKNLFVVSCLSIAVGVATFAIFCTDSQQSQREYKIGRIPLEELTSIIGGSGESQDCFIEPTDTCAFSRNSQSSCVAGPHSTTTFQSCNSIWREYLNNSTGVHRSKSVNDDSNTLGFRYPAIDCYDEYEFTITTHKGSTMFGGYSCNTEDDTCVRSNSVPSDYDCKSCIRGALLSPDAITVNSAGCSDP